MATIWSTGQITFGSTTQTLKYISDWELQFAWMYHSTAFDTLNKIYIRYVYNEYFD